MAIDVSDLIRAHEPILYFAEGERFFPSDCKRYLERCALWNALAPFDQKASWRRGGPGSYPGPIIQHRQVSARPDEPGTVLGEAQGGSLPFLFASGPNDGFLELAGWTDAPSVGPHSENRFANLGAIATLYNAPAAPAADPTLKDSRFWYHAEVFDTPRLRPLMMDNNAPAHFRELFPTLLQGPPFGDPLLLCYYLFFPGHDEGLDECESTADADKFGSFAGEWACISILFKCEVTDIPVGGGPGTAKCLPTAIGLTSRNVGNIGFLGGEQRVGMRVHDWSEVMTVVGDRGPGKMPGNHPRLFVAKGTHGLYPRERDQPVPFFSPEDSARQHCGAAELLDKSLEDLDEEAEDAADDTWVDDTAVVVLKSIFAPFGLLWTGLEWIIGGGGGFEGVASRTPDQFDHPPLRDAPEHFGVIVHPAGIVPPKGEIATKFVWPNPLADEARLEMKIADRRYSMLVDRISPDPLVRQVWWPGIQGQTGYAGRWGQRVARDPKARRAGMKFPEFWAMFMNELAKKKAQ